jgi:phospholipid/cholesterol/gamma-HCH transport system substrate-binding protein
LKITREVKTAILVISGILLFVYLFNFLKGNDILDSSRTFYTIYDNVEGLEPSTPVTINGLNVGRVQEIGFTDDGSGRLLVKLMVEKEFEFSKNSKAQLYEAGLIGGKAVAIIPAFDNAEKAVKGDYLVGTVKAGLSELVNKRLAPLQEKLETTIVSADSLLLNINSVFDERTKTNLRNSIAELNSTISSFKTTSSSLNELVVTNQDNLESTLKNIENISSNLSEITDSIVKSDLAQTITNLENTISNFNAILIKIENGEGSMGKLMQEEGLYNNLEGATRELEELLKDIKLHPKRYFRILSKKEIPYSEN